MPRKRKNYSSKFKTRVALEAVKEHLTMSEIASKYKIHPNMVSQWKKQLLEEVGTIFEDKRKNNRDKKEKSGEELISHLYREIGQMKVEVDFLKKKTF